MYFGDTILCYDKLLRQIKSVTFERYFSKHYVKGFLYTEREEIHKWN